MKFLFTHSYSKYNRGDAAIVSTMLHCFMLRFPKVHLSLITLDEFKPGETFEGVSQEHSFFYWSIYASRGPVARAVRTVWVMIVTLLWVVVYRSVGVRLNFLVGSSNARALQEYVSADVVIPVGGGYLVGKKTVHDTVTIMLQLHAILVARVLAKPVVLFSQSIGPFATWLQRSMVGVVLNRVQVICARESLTIKNLQALKVTKPEIVLTADAAFLFEPPHTAKLNEVAELRALARSGVVGITVRRWMKPNQQSAYERTIADFAQWLVGAGYAVVFVPQVTSAFHNDDDSLVHERIRALLPSDQAGVTYLPSSFTYTDVKNALGACDYVVGTRMHSVIFALTSLVPALAIAYERKTIGVMAELGLPEYVIPIEEVQLALLKSGFEKLVREAEAYKQHVATSLLQQQKLAELAFAKVEELLGKLGLS